MKDFPLGYFALFGQDDQDAYVNGDPSDLDSNTRAAGARLHVVWQDIETAQGVYDWTVLDNAIARASAHGQKLGVSISAGRFSPRWIYEVASPPLQYVMDPSDTWNGGNPDQPLPWDANFLTLWQSFVQAVGDRYDSNPTIAYVVLGGFMELSELPISKNDSDTIAMNNIAKDPATYAPGATGFTAYDDTAPASYDAPWGTSYAPPHPGQTGFALIRAYLESAWTIMNYFKAAFPTTPCLLTGSQGVLGAGGTDQTNQTYVNWATWVSARVRNGCTAVAPYFGLTYASLYAELPDYNNPAGGNYAKSGNGPGETGGHPEINATNFPSCRQAIYSTQNATHDPYQGVDVNFSDGVTSTSAGTLQSTQVGSGDNAFNSADIGRPVTGSAFAAGTVIASIVSSDTVTVSPAPIANGTNSFVITKRQPPDAVSNGGTWPQWKAVRDQIEAAIYRGAQFMELYPPDLNSTDTDVQAQLDGETAKLNSLYGGDGIDGNLPEVIIFV